jgi:phosphonate transport system substrate-binding protein
MMPLVYLLRAGLKPVPKPETNSMVAEQEVGYVFAGKDATTLQWVIDGKVDAGVIDSETFKTLSPETKARLKILMETENFPRQVVVVPPGIKPEQLEAFKAVLMAMDESQQGQVVLQQFDNTAKFDEFPEGTEVALAKISKAYQLIEEFEQQNR